VLLLNPGRASRCLYTIFLPRVESHDDNDAREAEERFRREVECEKEEVGLVIPGLRPVLLVGKPDCVKREGDCVLVYEFTSAKKGYISYYKLVQKSVQAAFYALAYEEKCKRTGECRCVKTYVVFEVGRARYVLELPKDAAGRARRWIAEAVEGNIVQKLYFCDKCPYRGLCKAKMKSDKIRYDREFALEVLKRAVAAGLPTKKPWYGTKVATEEKE